MTSAPPPATPTTPLRGERVLHSVPLSGGKDSTATALRLKELHPDLEFVYPITPTGNELPEMIVHWVELGRRLGRPLTPVATRSLEGLMRGYDALPNWRQRWCTRQIKIEPYAAWLLEQTKEYDRVISYIGLRADEEAREGGDYSAVPGTETRFPMREWGWGISNVYAYLEQVGQRIPTRTDCAWCFYQTLPEWHNLWTKHPEIYFEGARWEEKTGHTFRSPSRDTWPASLMDLANEFTSGRVPKPRRDKMAEMKCRVCRS